MAYGVGSGGIIGRGTIEIGADTRKLDEALLRIERAAAKTGAGVANSAGAFSAFGEASKKIQQSQMVSQLETIAALGIQAGGTVSQLASVTTSLIRPLATLSAVAGPAGIAIAGVGVAAGGAVLGAKALVNAAIEAEGRLKALGVTVDSDVSEPLDEFEAASRQLGIELDVLKTGIGAELAPALTALVSVLAEGVRLFDDVREATEPLRDALATVARVGIAAVSLGVSEMTLALVNYSMTAPTGVISTRDLEIATLDLATAIGLATEQSNLEAEARQDTIEGARQQALAAQRETEAKQAAAQAERDFRALLEEPVTWQLAEIMTAGEIDAWAQQTVEWRQHLGELADNELVRVGQAAEMLGPQFAELAEQWETWTAEAEAAAAALEVWGEVNQEIADAFIAVANEMTDVWVQGAMDRASADASAARTASAEYDRLADHLASLQEQRRKGVDDATRAELDAEIAATEGKLAIADEESRARKAAALDAWEDGQKAQAAQVAINAAAAFGMTAATSPIPFPGNLIAAGTVSAAVLAQLIPIAAASPPQFPTGVAGFDPDHYAVGMQAGESMLNRRATDGLGEDFIRAANNGESVGGGGTNIYLGRKLIGAAVRSSRTRPIDPRAGKWRR